MLNVLPNDKRNLLYYENWLLIVRQVCCTLMVSFAIVAMVVYGSHFILTSWYTTLTTNTTGNVTIDSAKALELTTTVQQLRQLTAGLKLASSSWHNPLPIVTAVVEQLPEHTSLTTFDLTYTNNQLHLTGLVSDRAAITALQEQLSHLTLAGYTQDKPQFFVSDLTLKTNIPFTFNTSLIPTPNSL